MWKCAVEERWRNIRHTSLELSLHHHSTKNRNVVFQTPCSTALHKHTAHCLLHFTNITSAFHALANLKESITNCLGWLFHYYKFASYDDITQDHFRQRVLAQNVRLYGCISVLRTAIWKQSHNSLRIPPEKEACTWTYIRHWTPVSYICIAVKKAIHNSLKQFSRTGSALIIPHILTSSHPSPINSDS